MGVKRTGRYGRLSREYHRKPMDERLSNYVEDESGCWVWQGGKDRGYGKLRFDTKTVLVHRIAYAHKYGPITPRLMVCHSCGKRDCINPEHLYLGTAKDNAADMVRHGRAGTQKGEGHGCSKLTEREVLAIRASDMPITRLAQLYGVRKSNISSIRNRKTWRHI